MLALVALFTMQACDEDEILEEIPSDFLNSDVVLVDKAGFESALTALHVGVRDGIYLSDGFPNYYAMHIGTDVATTGVEGLPQFRDYNITLTPFFGTVDFFWNWAYLSVFPRANTIIEAAENPDVVWESEAEKNAVIAEARFMRGYANNVMANIFGGIPIVDRVETAPRLDYVRNTREEVLQFAKEDLIFASQWLPETTEIDGRIVKGAADHLLSEVYISLGEYTNAIASATDVIDSGLYNLMTTRFGSAANEPGDVFSDLFKDNNQNRSSGNMESIWVIQIEFQTPGGEPGAGGNNWLRRWGPRYWALRDPDGNPGMILASPFGRGVAQVRPNSYSLFTIWQSDFDNDIRNSEFNIRRTWFYNNPESNFFGQEVIYDPATSGIDSLRFYPSFTKIEGEALAGANRGRTFTDYMIMRLAETYLLRAEAHLLNGNPTAAADDINIVRARANATPVSAGEVDIDYILDERARELMVEEPRRRTLVRMGRLVDRVREYNIRQDTRETIQDFHRWFPIPQSAIDANIGAELEQNPGY
ncbi:MAG: RagB/SusD family nutrient uptake outer membrane protein [Bacteroidota bacterium]